MSQRRSEERFQFRSLTSQSIHTKGSLDDVVAMMPNGDCELARDLQVPRMGDEALTHGLSKAARHGVLRGK